MTLPRALTLMVLVAACSGGDDDGGMMGPPGDQVLTSITTNITTATLVAGEVASITVTALDQDNQPISSPGTPTFTSSAPAVANVDGVGTLVGFSEGSAEITVSLTRSGVTKTAVITANVTGTLPTQATVIAGSSANTFTPPVLAIGAGGSVTWSFGQLEHTVTFSGGSGAPANIGSGISQQVTRTFATAGSFSYVCTIHAGMAGRVIVH